MPDTVGFLFTSVVVDIRIAVVSHWQKINSLLQVTVEGKIAIQVQGKEPEYFGEGATVSFKPGEVHKFWNPG
ncbi:MAG: hypothetical protein JWR18_2590 [Segetibacter sp.]|nr:hypothetical protein [Segetibacter sp.]